MRKKGERERKVKGRKIRYRETKEGQERGRIQKMRAMGGEKRSEKCGQR